MNEQQATQAFDRNAPVRQPAVGRTFLIRDAERNRFWHEGAAYVIEQLRSGCSLDEVEYVVTAVRETMLAEQSRAAAKVHRPIRTPAARKAFAGNERWPALVSCSHCGAMMARRDISRHEKKCAGGGKAAPER